MAFWHPEATPEGATEPLAVALPDAHGSVAVRTVPAVVRPVREALPVLTRARAAGGHPAAGF